MALVTSVANTLKQQYLSNTQPLDAEEILKRKQNMICLADEVISQFRTKLATGEIELKSVSDFEKMAKLILILSGEADRISGKPSSQVEDGTVTKEISQSLSKDDPDVKALYEKVFAKYNIINDV